jgi:hypothetical protein
MPQVIVISGNPPFSGNYTLPPEFGDDYNFGDGTPCHGFLSAYQCSDDNMFESVLMHFDKKFTAMPVEVCDLECRFRYDPELWFTWISRSKKLYTQSNIIWNDIYNRYQTSNSEFDENPSSDLEETIAVSSYDGNAMLESKLGKCHLYDEHWMKHIDQAACSDDFLASSSMSSSSS